MFLWDHHWQAFLGTAKHKNEWHLYSPITKKRTTTSNGKKGKYTFAIHYIGDAAVV